MLDIKLND